MVITISSSVELYQIAAEVAEVSSSVSVLLLVSSTVG